jgi:hypothetical protein
MKVMRPIKKESQVIPDKELSKKPEKKKTSGIANYMTY